MTSTGLRSSDEATMTTIQNMGVRLGKAELSSFGRQIRSYGIVHENERRQTDITARVEGWVEDLRVTAVGDTVKKGDLIFKLYSPQLIISQGDYQRSRGERTLAGRGEGQLRSYGVQPQAMARGISTGADRGSRIPISSDRGNGRSRNPFICGSIPASR